MTKFKTLVGSFIAAVFIVTLLVALISVVCTIVYMAFCGAWWSAPAMVLGLAVVGLTIGIYDSEVN